MGLRCGIDLGTTYSAISWYDDFNVRVDTIDLESADGQRVIRSVVYYPGPGHPPVVGEPAWNAGKTDPDRVVVGVKRSMGTDYKTPPIDGARYTPQQVSAEILKVLVKDAQTHLGETIDAKTAHDWGLATAVVPPAELAARAAEACARLAAKPPTALRTSKALLKEAGHATVKERIAHEAGFFARQLASAEVREAISAFFEKRTPDFSKLG